MFSSSSLRWFYGFAALLFLLPAYFSLAQTPLPPMILRMENRNDPVPHRMLTGDALIPGRAAWVLERSLFLNTWASMAEGWGSSSPAGYPDVLFEGFTSGTQARLRFNLQPFAAVPPPPSPVAGAGPLIPFHSAQVSFTWRGDGWVIAEWRSGGNAGGGGALVRARFQPAGTDALFLNQLAQPVIRCQSCRSHLLQRRLLPRVDEDDGTQNGGTTYAYTWTVIPDGGRPSSIDFGFLPNGEEKLPEYAGAVLLGGQTGIGGLNNYSTILVYDSAGVEITDGQWQVMEPRLPPLTPWDTFMADRFAGIYYPGGISRITFLREFSIDHLQYGYAIPEPGAAGLLAAEAGLLARRRCARPPMPPLWGRRHY